jgi:hypothetical protein
MSDTIIKISKSKFSGGKKGRKIGRKKKSPAQQRYNADRRWEKNKRRRINKDNKRHKGV